MKIEVTEKEAHAVYYYRYKEPRAKLKAYLIIPLNIIGAGVAYWFVWPAVGSVLSAGLFFVLLIPTAIMTFSSMRAAKRYARGQIEAIK